MKKAFPVILFLLCCGKLRAQKAYAAFEHVALYVGNLDSSVNFYSGLFRFDTLPNPFPKFRVKWYKIGQGLQLHLIEGARERSSPPFMHHICFSVASIKDFTAKLDERAVPYYSGADMKRGVQLRADGVHQIFFKDPDGYWVEVNDAARR